jgi:hypothetical protein
MAIPEKYFGNLPPSLRATQAKLIRKSQDIYEKTGKVVDRPKVSNQPVKRSKHAKKFEDKYGFSVSDISKVKSTFPDTDVDMILSKGRGAYASSGSRPNTTSEAWAKARLASALTGGKAYKIDKSHIGEKSKDKIFS